MDILKNIFEKKVFSKLQLTIILILILFFSVTSATYAYFAFSVTNDVISGEAATVNLTLNVTKIFPLSSSENTGVMVPQLSVSGSSNSPLNTALKMGCVDGNKNVVCHVYEVTIANVGGTANQMVDGEILFYSDNTLTRDVSLDMPNLKWKLIENGGVDPVTPANSELGSNIDLVADANSDNIFAEDVVLATNEYKEYYIIVWINETNTDQKSEPSKTFYAKIVFNSSNGTGVTSTFKP